MAIQYLVVADNQAQLEQWATANSVDPTTCKLVRSAADVQGFKDVTIAYTFLDDIPADVADIAAYAEAHNITQFGEMQ